MCTWPWRLKLSGKHKIFSKKQSMDISSFPSFSSFFFRFHFNFLREFWRFLNSFLVFFSFLLTNFSHNSNSSGKNKINRIFFLIFLLFFFNFRDQKEIFYFVNFGGKAEFCWLRRFIFECFFYKTEQTISMILGLSIKNSAKENVSYWVTQFSTFFLLNH
jgi:hypothetical protein